MNSKQNKRLDLLIDQALQDFPVESVPVNLTSRIMERIEKPLPQTGFRISWSDFAFSGLLAVLAGFLLDFLQGVARSPYWANRVRVALILLWQDLKYFILHNYQPVMTITVSLVMVSFILIVLASVYWRYIVVSERLPT